MSDLLHILQHSLGVDQYGRGDQYREHFCAGPGHSDYDTCCEAVAMGLMTRADGLPVVGGTMFYVTPEGRQWMADNRRRELLGKTELPPPAKIGGGQ